MWRSQGQRHVASALPHQRAAHCCSTVKEVPGVIPIDISSWRDFSSLMLQNLMIPVYPFVSHSSDEYLKLILEKNNKYQPENPDTRLLIEAGILLIMFF